MSNTANTAAPVTAQQVKSVEEIKPAKAPTVKEQILELVKEFNSATTPEDKLAAADLLVELRGKARKPWAAFGVGNDIVAKIADVRSTYTCKLVGKPKPVKAAKAKVTKAPANSKHADNLRSILNDTSYSDYQKGHALHDYKRAAKKSFAAMGLTEAEAQMATRLAIAATK